MILVLLLISAIALGIGIYISTYDDCNFAGPILTIFGSLAVAVCLIVSACLWSDIANISVVDKKIEMYTEQNAAIEKRIEDTIMAYQDYEKETFKEFAEKDVMVALSLYPELKSDKLIEKQISTYVNNQEQINDLKATKLEAELSKWWLYFGGTK